jgi:hypothetical protein
MNLRTLTQAASLALMILLGPVTAAHAADPDYRIDVTVSRDGSLIGKPAIVAKPGAQAELREEDPLKPDQGFRILVTATPIGDSPNGKESVQLHVVFHGRFHNQWVARGDHTVTALVGRNVSLAFPPSEREPGASRYDLVLTTSQVTAPAK